MKTLTVFGTRPEAIKMAPVVTALQSFSSIQNLTCVTAQHRELLDQVLEIFGIVPEIDLDLMAREQRLPQLTANVIQGMTDVLEECRPDVVLVHGDTTTSFATALAAFYAGIPVAHVEAGLRTRNLSAPFPEEFNRQATARIARWNFAPTEEARQNLLAEGIEGASINVVGNTIVDALQLTVARIKSDPILLASIGNRLGSLLDPDWHTRDIVLITAHRRENFGSRLESICRAIAHLAESHPEALFVYPVHPNPNVRGPVAQLLSKLPNVRLTQPLDYPEFIWLLNSCRFALTDSGGVQEEAPILGKPVLLLRDSTERPEGVDNGAVRMVGASEQRIISESDKLLGDSAEYSRRSKRHSMLGDGNSATRIANCIIEASTQ